MKFFAFTVLFLTLVVASTAWDHIIGSTKDGEMLVYTKGQSRSIPKPKTLTVKFSYNGSQKLNEITHVDLKIREVSCIKLNREILEGGYDLIFCFRSLPCRQRLYIKVDQVVKHSMLQ